MEQYGAAADQVYAWLSAGKNVLVHCEMGQSRSPAVIACLFMKYRNMSLREAMDLIFKRRRCVRTLERTQWKAHLKHFEANWRQHAVAKRKKARRKESTHAHRGSLWQAKPTDDGLSSEGKVPEKKRGISGFFRR